MASLWLCMSQEKGEGVIEQLDIILKTICALLVTGSAMGFWVVLTEKGDNNGN